MYRGWVYVSEISAYEALLLYNTMQKLPDEYYYNPIAIAKREEIGMKYRYLCIASPKYNPVLSSYFADIEIYKPISGMPYATNIYKVGFDKAFPHRLPYL